MKPFKKIKKNRIAEIKKFNRGFYDKETIRIKIQKMKNKRKLDGQLRRFNL